MKKLLYFLLTIVNSLTDVAAETFTVKNYSELSNAINQANSLGGNSIINLQDGTYTLSDSWLTISAPNITITGTSGNRNSVILQGDSMSDTARVQYIFQVTSSGFKLSNLTLQKVRYHLLKINGENNADQLEVKNVVFRDAYQQLLKGSANVDANNITIGSTTDNGLIENCLFEYTAGIGPNYYIGGIDVHGGNNWVVRGNTFKNIISPSITQAEFAIHFWNKSANNLIEKNIMINNDRGVGFGLSNRGNTAGIIRNNFIFHSANKGSFADTGIYIEDSPNTQVYNNSIYFENNYPNAIEYRFALTSGVLIANNLSNKSIVSRDGATGSVANNYTTALGSWFANLSQGDLHLNLNSSLGSILKQGKSILGLVDDIDSQKRISVDIGADQISDLTITNIEAPKNFRIIKSPGI